MLSNVASLTIAKSLSVSKRTSILLTSIIRSTLLLLLRNKVNKQNKTQYHKIHKKILNDA